MNIIDSDDEQPMPHCRDSGRTSFSAETERISENNEEDSNFGDVPFIAAPKRKRACKNIVTSESESDEDDDDNVPISKLIKRMHNIEEVSPDQVKCDLNNSVTTEDLKVTGTITLRRRRLVPLRKCKNHQDNKNPSCGPTNENSDELEEVLSGSEEESLSNFIVNDSDVSDCEDTSSKSLDESDGDVDLSKILSRIQRIKGQKMKWECEAEMLAAFGKDPELCMKAVCTLHRQQTFEEQMSKGSLCYNGRGFSNRHAFRGSNMAEFLTNGDPLGDLKKSVQELQEFDPEGVEFCRKMALHYSKQLFKIYENEEDPLFP
ncbi:protein IWS1-like protein [Senna tora]|uniref:Protein IWS1-like protein n=1 Tax=Senna tora TaxID=362788 RepID=A0A834U1L8_9FABA|nr:protein IWS1-like protein [Senna tora]